MDMRFRRASPVLLLSLILACLCVAQTEVIGTRRVEERVAPIYPTIARNMHIRGSVKLEAVVAPTGTVKSLQIKGGHPVLAQAAVDAVTKWKWSPSSHETVEPIQINFDTD
jgi:TonB family protein